MQPWLPQYITAIISEIVKESVYIFLVGRAAFLYTIYLYYLMHYNYKKHIIHIVS